MSLFRFDVTNTFEKSRTGVLKFDNGIHVETPVFMPVGTRGSVKAVSQESLEEIGFNLILANTYHLYLRPGTVVLKEFGGIKKFMSWPRLILTDSGGYQAFSLSKLTRYSAEGIHFKSHIDGSPHFFTPEKVLDIQDIIRSDIVMPLDDCAPYPADEKRLRQSLERTHQWIGQSLHHWKRMGYDKTRNLFGIIQGGTNLAFRSESVDFMKDLDLPGYAIGGLSVGEKNDEFRNVLAATAAQMPEHKPRYLMGVGSIPEILFAVNHGIDMFDCVLPTRNARNGQVFTSLGKLNLRAEYNKFLDKPIDENCGCRVCKRYSLGYIRHLHKTQELLAYELSSFHNLFFMHQLMGQIRNSIRNNDLPSLTQDLNARFTAQVSEF
ncbi:MAG: tRNA guanosine(34) transglycosylase Tgt [Spirochaetia bacterium]|nr:tRNA guanosine(34) transglycosylase Tgt [Spirochaetia bacterium]